MVYLKKKNWFFSCHWRKSLGRKSTRNICVKTTFTTGIQKYFSLESNWYQYSRLNGPFHKILNKPYDQNWYFTWFLLKLLNSRRILTLPVYIRTTRPERPERTITTTWPSLISLYTQWVGADCEARTLSCSCDLTGRCWSCVSAVWDKDVLRYTLTQSYRSHTTHLRLVFTLAGFTPHSSVLRFLFNRQLEIIITRINCG